MDITHAPYLHRKIEAVLKLQPGKWFTVVELRDKIYVAKKSEINNYTRRVLYAVKQLPRSYDRIELCEDLTNYRTKFYKIRYV